MRAVIQRVLEASVSVDGQTVSRIGKGLCILVGINKKDTPAEMQQLIQKILNIRLFPDESGKHWAKSVKEASLDILCVSQFTLYAKLQKGKKPDFHNAMSTVPANELYSKFLDELRRQYSAERIQDGVFGAMMLVDIKNDGPVTIIMDTAGDTAGDLDRDAIAESSSGSLANEGSSSGGSLSS